MRAGGTSASFCTEGGGGQCSQLISSLSGLTLSELISFVERDNESVFGHMNLGRSLSDGLPPILTPAGWTLLAVSVSFKISGKGFLFLHNPNSMVPGLPLEKSFLQSNPSPPCRAHWVSPAWCKGKLRSDNVGGRVSERGPKTFPVLYSWEAPPTHQTSLPPVPHPTLPIDPTLINLPVGWPLINCWVEETGRVRG